MQYVGKMVYQKGLRKEINVKSLTAEVKEIRSQVQLGVQRLPSMQKDLGSMPTVQQAGKEHNQL